MTEDPRAILALERMTPRQAIAVGLCVLLVALDGFDVLAISFASPGIAKEWGIDRAALGIVLSMEIIGMALGSLALGNVADRIGRRPTVLGCLVVMTAGMFLATTARGVEPMSVFRFIDRRRHRRDARGDQCRGGGVRQQPPAQPRGDADGNGLSARRRLRRHDCDQAARGRRLALGFHVRHARHRPSASRWCCG